jgi:hypothetical protein
MSALLSHRLKSVQYARWGFGKIMVITQVSKVRTSDPSGFAWAGLRKFQNVENVAQKLEAIHKVPAKYKDAVRKQALQIRYCLIQAREYFTTAAAVTTATKPNLLYYGTMSLALAEILFKQSGESSLDKARQQNRHHGLTMTVGAIRKSATLSESAALIRAHPVEQGGLRKGTFELWRRRAENTRCRAWLLDSGLTEGQLPVSKVYIPRSLSNIRRCRKMACPFLSVLQTYRSSLSIPRKPDSPHHLFAENARLGFGPQNNGGRKM